jgi:alkanesulfonate monooxygenase SsuD/methylene tetrahydromethanopterin reductase-like flavin-dependent oxidoreductase (luciferase family)
LKLGIHSDLRNPPGWRRDWTEHYAAALRRIEEAERLGLDGVWLSEHHLFEDGYLPQPLTFAAAAAARTERIRIGTATMLPTLRPALDTAEQAAVVDILSAGRLELGLGTGYRVPEFEAFGTTMEGRYERLEERCREIRRRWEGGDLSPPPVQQRLPLWIGAQGPRGARLAGRVGAGLLSLRPDLLEVYEAGLAEFEGDAEPRLAGPVNLILADDPERTWDELRPYVAYQWETYQAYGAEGKPTRGRGGAEASDGPDAGGRATVDLDRLRSAGPDMNPPRIDVVTPAEAARRLDAWLGGAPVEHAFFWDSIAGMPDAVAARHLELLGTGLAPLVGDDAAARDRP